MPSPESRAAFEPLPYHQAIRDYLRREEREVWEWFASNQVRAEQAEAVRFELLKATYRIDRETRPEQYAAADEVARALGLDIPITLYQAQNALGTNASLAYLPGEAHIVLHGPIATLLTPAEFRALLGHELSHQLLWQGWQGEYLVAHEVLCALANDRHATPTHQATARLYELYNEIFCDRGALEVARDPAVVIAMLVKVATGLEAVSPESYLKQAAEIVAGRVTKSDRQGHPEDFIRALAVKLWADEDPDSDGRIARMIEGPRALEELDLLGQQHVAALTRRLVDVALTPAWMQTDPVLAHARLYFDGYAPPAATHADPTLAGELATDDPGLRDYYCFVLLDLVVADRDLEDAPLAAAMRLADEWGLKAAFTEIARRELRLQKKQWEKIDQDKDKILAAAGQLAPSS